MQFVVMMLAIHLSLSAHAIQQHSAGDGGISHVAAHNTHAPVNKAGMENSSFYCNLYSQSYSHAVTVIGMHQVKSVCCKDSLQQTKTYIPPPGKQLMDVGVSRVKLAVHKLQTYRSI